MKNIEPLGSLRPDQFDTLIFAGGGNRCWWQAGILTELLDRGWQMPRQLIGTSGGAAMATAAISGGIDKALQECCKLYSSNARLFDWRSLGKLKLRFVHEELYPAWIATLVNEHNFHAIQSSPHRLSVAVTTPARFLGMSGSVTAGTLAYMIEKYVSKAVHPRLPQALGLRQRFFSLHECASASAAQTLLVATAAAPPFMPSRRVLDVRCIDGGYTDNAPIPPQSLEERTKTLVLLTRHYPHLPTLFRMSDRTYWQPSRRVPVSTWDCRAKTTVDVAFAHGIEDAKAMKIGMAVDARTTS